MMSALCRKKKARRGLGTGSKKLRTSLMSTKISEMQLGRVGLTDKDRDKISSLRYESLTKREIRKKPRGWQVFNFLDTRAESLDNGSYRFLPRFSFSVHERLPLVSQRATSRERRSVQPTLLDNAAPTSSKPIAESKHT